MKFSHRVSLRDNLTRINLSRWPELFNNVKAILHNPSECAIRTRLEVAPRLLQLLGDLAKITYDSGAYMSRLKATLKVLSMVTPAPPVIAFLHRVSGRS